MQTGRLHRIIAVDDGVAGGEAPVAELVAVEPEVPAHLVEQDGGHFAAVGQGVVDPVDPGHAAIEVAAEEVRQELDAREAEVAAARAAGVIDHGDRGAALDRPVRQRLPPGDVLIIFVAGVERVEQLRHHRLVDLGFGGDQQRDMLAQPRFALIIDSLEGPIWDNRRHATLA